MHPLPTLVKPIPEFCERLGKIPGDDYIFTGEDSAYAIKVVDTLPNPDESNDAIIVLGKTIGDFGKGSMLTITRDKYGVRTWTVVTDPTKGVGVPTGIVSHTLPVGSVYDNVRVNIRWSDPVDQYPLVWKKTVLVRKALGYPTNINDGIVVVENRVRDYYRDRSFVDEYPSVIDTEWFYRIFAVSADGVVTSNNTTCKFKPKELNWSKIHDYIQDGVIRDLFRIGDVISFDSGLSVTVVGFDEATISDSTYKHSMTLMTRKINNVVFDLPWGNYYQVIDEYVAYAGQKAYYTRSGAGTDANPYKYTYIQIPSGTTITAAMNIWTPVRDAEAAINGKNVWKTSKARSVANAFVLDPVLQEILVDTVTGEDTTDKFFIPSLDELKGDTAYSYFKQFGMSSILSGTRHLWTRTTGTENRLVYLNERGEPIDGYKPKALADCVYLFTIG